MNVQLRLVPAVSQRPVWPKDWPVPRVGENVRLDKRDWVVASVTWYPFGNADEEIPPGVYVVLHRG